MTDDHPRRSDQPDPKEESATFDINEFLEENYELFAILSIFGVLTFYIFELPRDSNSLNPSSVGFISSLSLFLLTCFGIFKRLLSEIGVRITSETFEAIRGKMEFFVFLFSLIGLLIGFLGFGISFSALFAFLVQLSIFFSTILGATALMFEFQEIWIRSEYYADLDSQYKTVLDSLIGFAIFLSLYGIGWLTTQIPSTPGTFFTETQSTIRAGLTLAGISFGVLALVELFFLVFTRLQETHQRLNG